MDSKNSEIYRFLSIYRRSYLLWPPVIELKHTLARGFTLGRYQVYDI